MTLKDSGYPTARYDRNINQKPRLPGAAQTGNRINHWFWPDIECKHILLPDNKRIQWNWRPLFPILSPVIPHKRKNDEIMQNNNQLTSHEAAKVTMQEKSSSLDRIEFREDVPSIHLSDFFLVTQCWQVTIRLQSSSRLASLAIADQNFYADLSPLKTCAAAGGRMRTASQRQIVLCTIFLDESGKLAKENWSDRFMVVRRISF